MGIVNSFPLTTVLAGDAVEGLLFIATSTTSVAIGTDPVTLETQDGRHYPVGSYVKAASDGNSANFMVLEVTDYADGSLTGNLIVQGGSGTHADWTITPAQTSIADGGTGATTAVGARGNLGLEDTSTDNAIVRFAGTTGETQNSGVTVDDSNNIAGAGFDTATAGNSLKINGLAATANTGTGAVVRATSPSLTTPNIGAATASSINGATVPSVSDTLVGRATTDTLTNKGINAGNNTITNLTTSMFAANVVDTDATLAANSTTRIPAQSAVKSYVDNALSGLKWKAAVLCATTGNITLSGEQTIDGQTTSASRVLVKNQTTGSQNGIYVSGSGSWTRATDADTSAEITQATVFVQQGTVNADTQWTCSTDNITLGTTSLTFSQVSGAGTYSAGTGLTLSGNQFSVDTAITATLTASQAFTNKTYNGLTITSTTGTLTIASGKTATVSNTLTFTGTDGSTVALGGGGTVVYNTRSISTAAGLKGGGNLSADRTIDYDIPSLTAKATPDANNDYVILYDAAGTATKKATVASVASSATAGVSSIASLTGAFTLSNGLTNSGNDIRFAALPAFLVDKNGTDQTGVASGTYTQITFPHEVYDIGGYFASNGWTPPAGKVQMNACMNVTGTLTAGAAILLAIYKNGSILKQSISTQSASSTGCSIVIEDVANGTDVYTVDGFAQTSSGSATISGATTNTWFSGHWFSP